MTLAPAVADAGATLAVAGADVSLSVAPRARSQTLLADFARAEEKVDRLPPAKFRGLELRRQVAYGRIPPENLSRARRHEPKKKRKTRTVLPNEKMANRGKNSKGRRYPL